MTKCRTSNALGSLSRSLICLTLGFLIGIRITTFWYNLQNENDDNSTENETSSDDGNTANVSLSLKTYGSMSKYLFNTTRVLCWVLTNPANHQIKAIHVRNTWGKSCNKLLFMSTEEDEELQSVKLNVGEGRDQLWNKTKMALKYIYDHHYDEADWFLKVDDDTYVIMENLRYLLYSYSPDIPIYFGARFKPIGQQGYMPGGTGYVLSKETLRKFVVEAYANSEMCPKVFNLEDVQLGFCLQNIGVLAGDSRDEWGKERFFPLAVEHLIPSDVSYWNKNYTYYEHKEKEGCCSSQAISFRCVKAEQFYILDYLIYKLRPFGVLENTNLSLPKRQNDLA